MYAISGRHQSIDRSDIPKKLDCWDPQMHQEPKTAQLSLRRIAGGSFLSRTQKMGGGL